MESGWRASDSLPDPAHTFPGVFARAVATAPDKIALHVVTTSGREPQARPVTVAQLDGMARRAARTLRVHGVGCGDRVILSLSTPDLFLAFFLGALGLGAVPVPLPSVTDLLFPAAVHKRVRSVTADCAPRALVLESLRGWEPWPPDPAQAIAIVNMTEHDLQRAAPVEGSEYDLIRDFQEVAFLQYTSGSTETPKGVVVTHHNLVANLRASAEAAEIGPHDRSFSWLPLFHDMGLIGGLLLPLYLQIPAYVMPPRSFLARPDAWLRAIDRFRATVSGGPTFAYSALAHRLSSSATADLDLSSWRLAFCGAEPIARGTVEAFIRRFERYGFRASSFYPVYGLAECTLSVAYPRPGSVPRFETVDRESLASDRCAVPVDGAQPNAITFVSVGQAIPGHRLRIVDPEGEDELPERCVGEIVVTGPSVTPFYFRKLGPPRPPRMEVRTGDLGYVADGDLFIVDRLKDVLIIAGKTYVPSDIERVVGTVSGVRAGAVIAFALPGSDGTDDLYILAGTEGDARAPEQLGPEVGRVVQREIGISPKDVCLIRPGALPRTSSGKLERDACRRMYASSAFRSVVGLPQGSR